MNLQQIVLVIGVLILCACTQKQSTQFISIDETSNTWSINEVIEIDTVWPGPSRLILYKLKKVKQES
jgi:hypothetical protein